MHFGFTRMIALNDSTDPNPDPISDGATAPAVTVVIPAYMAAPFIAETIGSVLAQTFGDFEVVVNDGSPDTEELERALEPFRDSMVYLCQENAGPSTARNRGIRQSRGEWIALLDSDDLWDPQFLESQMAFLYRHPNVDLVYADALVMGDPPLAGKTFMSNCPSEGEVTVESLIRARCTVVTSTTPLEPRFRRFDHGHTAVKNLQTVGRRESYLVILLMLMTLRVPFRTAAPR